MVGTSAYDDGSSSGDEAPAVRAPARPARPGLLNRWKPKDDDEPYENQGSGDVNKKASGDSTSKFDNDDTKTVASSFASRKAGEGSEANINASTRSGINKSSKSMYNNTEMQEVMKDNLELMYEIVMKIREDEDYARSIYKNCPRLQNLLDQYPDLRPLFEDPNLVRINFEKVYRDAGGILPGDEKELNRFQKILKYIVSHPLFRVFKILLFIKKIISCVLSGGAALASSVCKSLFWTPDATALPGGADGTGNNVNTTGTGNGTTDGNTEDGTVTCDGPGVDANKVALNRAAEHMSDPTVQANMNNLIQNDPEALDDYIENDPELKALRDSNPLCAELMSDPETMKIMTDPDNLRALADAPKLIEQDFADPNWSPPELDAPPDDMLDDVNNNNDGIGGVNSTGGIDNDGNTNSQNTRGGSNNISGTDAEDDAALEDFELGESEADNNYNNNNSNAINDTGAEGESAMDDFELGESDNFSNNNNNNMNGNNATSEENEGLEDFELGDSTPDNMNQSSINGANQQGDDYEDANAIEDFELGDSYNENNNANNASGVDGNNYHAEDDANAIEDFELGESYNNQNASGMVGNASGMENNYAEDDAALEDFALGESQDVSTSNYNNAASSGAEEAASEGAALDDFELGDSKADVGATNNTSYNYGGEEQAAAETGAFEDFELGESQTGQSSYAQNNSSPGMDANETSPTEDVAGVEEFELGDSQQNNNSVDSGDNDDGGGPQDTMESVAAANQKEKQQQARGEGEPRSEAAGVGGLNIVAQVAAGLTDVILGEVIGMGLNELTGGAMNNNEMNALDNALETADYAEDAADAAETRAAPGAGAANNLDEGLMVAGNADRSNQEQGQQQGSRSAPTADEAVSDEPAKPTTKMGRFASVISTTAKEQLFGVIVGEDFGEMLAERSAKRGDTSQKVDEEVTATTEGKDDDKKDDKKTGGISSRFFKKQE